MCRPPCRIADPSAMIPFCPSHSHSHSPTHPSRSTHPPAHHHAHTPFRCRLAPLHHMPSSSCHARTGVSISDCGLTAQQPIGTDHLKRGAAGGHDQVGRPLHPAGGEGRSVHAAGRCVGPSLLARSSRAGAAGAAAGAGGGGGTVQCLPFSSSPCDNAGRRSSPAPRGPSLAHP